MKLHIEDRLITRGSRFTVSNGTNFLITTTCPKTVYVHILTHRFDRHPIDMITSTNTSIVHKCVSTVTFLFDSTVCGFYIFLLTINTKTRFSLFSLPSCYHSIVSSIYVYLHRKKTQSLVTNSVVCLPVIVKTAS